jgi:hypothetical protein
MTPPKVIPAENKTEFDKACDAIEAEIARLQDTDYASKEAQELLDFEAAIVLAEYQGSK